MHNVGTIVLRYLVGICLAAACASVAAQEAARDETLLLQQLLQGQFYWQMSEPLFSAPTYGDDLYYSIKDPSIVYYNGRWHLFCTIRGKNRSHQIEYLTFSDWDTTDRAQRQMLKMHAGFFCAPQVFYFRPHKRWYLICQASDESWSPKYGAAFSTTDNIEDPKSWTPLRLLGAKPADGKAGLDFWIICDEQKAHLFFPTLDGRLWREETTLDDFPYGWSEPVLAIRGDIFEAAHIYKLKGLNRFLAIVEAQHGFGWRYYKAYLAERLEGPWEPLAATRQKSFASMKNVRHPPRRWTDSISHGELIRAGFDERMEVNPNGLRFLFQGVLDSERRGKPYGQIPWKLGMLVQVPTPDD